MSLYILSGPMALASLVPHKFT